MIKKSLTFILLVFAFAFNAEKLESREVENRMGVGFAAPFVNDLPALSFKMQKSPTFAFGALLALELEKDQGGYGAGLKFYRNLFDEPQLTFYSALLLALVGDTVNGKDNSGIQADITFGAEFSFVGLESLGFSFEFGGSYNTVYENSQFATAGRHLLVAGIHFYL